MLGVFLSRDCTRRRAVTQRSAQLGKADTSGFEGDLDLLLTGLLLAHIPHSIRANKIRPNRSI